MNTYFYTPNINDLDEMLELEKISFDKSEVVDVSFYEVLLKKCPENFICLMDEDKNKIIGFLTYIQSTHKLLDDDIFFTKDAPNDKTGKHAIIVFLAVHPDYKKMGFATMIMEEAFDDFYDLNLETVSLTCHDYLLDFYKKFGFENLGESKSKFANKQWFDMIKKL